MNRRVVFLVVIIAGILSGCATSPALDRVIYEDPTALVKLEPSKDSGGNSHPVHLNTDQVRIFLASISGRFKVGFIRSLTGEPGAPRLFAKEELDIVTGPIQRALAEATPKEEIVFYVEKAATETRVEITSGRLFIRDNVLYVAISNLRHPVIVSPYNVGATDRLNDVRETVQYVRTHPAVSVGDQDFVIFFDDPQYQMEQRGIQLFGHAERVLAIAYQPFLAANGDIRIREAEIQEAVEQATMRKSEAAAIADLKRRVAELEQTNRALSNKLQGQPTPTVPPPVSPDGSLNSPAQLQETIKRLEDRISNLEDQLRNTSKTNHPLSQQ